MRLACVYPSGPGANANAHYRALMPMRVLAERGHEIVWRGASAQLPSIRRLEVCDAIHIYRAADPALLRAMARLRAVGVALNWDNDDDVLSLPEHRNPDERLRGLGRQRDFALQMRAMRLADTVTTTSIALKTRFAAAGARKSILVDNYLPPEFIGVRRKSHKGIVIGWVAAQEHDADAARLKLTSVLDGVLTRNRDVRVVTVGLKLDVKHDRYEYRPAVPFPALPDAMRDFDIGIAPLADVSFNHARSSVKAKEYAALGLPWLGSAVGEYARLGRRQGGTLVADDQWCMALVRLIDSRARRAVLGARARYWASGQTIDIHVDRWERVFCEALRVKRAQGGPILQSSETGHRS